MARRPLTFGMRLRDAAREQTLRVRACNDGSSGYLVEREGRAAPSECRRHDSLVEAVRDGARRWRHRLN